MSNTPKRVILHCSATKNHQRLSIKEVDEWHRARGWRMIGYHYLIDIPGSIQLGRSEFDIGAHTKGQNEDSIGICIVGTDRFSEQQVQSLVRLYFKLQLRYGIQYYNWHGHYEFSRKKCPGIDMSFVRTLFKNSNKEHYGL